MPAVDPAWVLALMLEREPGAPYRETYPETAAAIAKNASASPLPGHSANETAALVASVAWFESRFRPDARGDCSLGRVTVDCRRAGAVPHSFCAMQINETNFRAYGTSRDELLGSIDRCVAVGLRMLRDSFRICSRRPAEERLSWYAAGGGGCAKPSEDARRKSKHRIALGSYLARRKRPVPEPERPVDASAPVEAPSRRPDPSEAP